MILNFKNILARLENYIFPEHCVICKQAGSLFCPACRIQVKSVSARCAVCGKKSNLGLTCKKCYRDNSDYPIDGVFAYGAYEHTHLKSVLKALKFQGLRQLGLILGRMLGRKLLERWHRYQLMQATASLPAPIIIALPLHRRRQRERGFNQSLLIAQGLAEICGWKIDYNLQRRSYQKPSAKLNYQLRLRQNKIFRYQKNANLQGQTIILVDDIFTTGATAFAAALALKQAGAGIIIVAVVAQSG